MLVDEIDVVLEDREAMVILSGVGVVVQIEARNERIEVRLLVAMDGRWCTSSRGSEGKANREREQQCNHGVVGRRSTEK